MATAHPPGKHVPQTADTTKKRSQTPCSTRSSLIGRLGQNAETKTAQNNRDYAVFNLATQESWKNDRGEYETRTEWHGVYAMGKLCKFAGKLEKGQLITLEGTLKYRDGESGEHAKHRLAEIHASSIKRLSRLESADDPGDVAEQGE